MVRELGLPRMNFSDMFNGDARWPAEMIKKDLEQWEKVRRKLELHWCLESDSD